MFEVVLAPEAQEFFSRADAPLARKWRGVSSNLNKIHVGTNIKRLTGKLTGVLRYRLGEWRVLYRVDDVLQRVHVLIIAHRRDVYE